MRCVALALLAALLRLSSAERRLATVSWGRDRRLAEGDELQVTIRLSTETWRLRLRRNYGLVASGAHVLHGQEGTTLGPGAAGDGSWARPAEHCFYLGELEGATGTTGATGTLDHLTASISTCNGQLSGMLIQGNRTFLLDAAESGEDTNETIGPVLAPRLGPEPPAAAARSAAVCNGQSSEGGDANKTPGSGNEVHRSVAGLVVNDFERYTAFGGQAGLAQLATHTVSVLNAVTGIYRAAPTNGAVFPYTVQVVLVAQHTFITSDPWTATMVGSEVAEDSLLEAFLTWSAAEMAAGKLPENDNRLLLGGSMAGTKASKEVTLPAKTGKATQKVASLQYVSPACHLSVMSSIRTGQVDHRRACGNRFRVKDGCVVTKAYAYICPACNGQVESNIATGQVNHRRVCGNQFSVKDGVVLEKRFKYTCPACNGQVESNIATGQVDHRTVCGNRFSVKDGVVLTKRLNDKSPKNKKRKK
eukprot:s2267_g1.t1